VHSPQLAACAVIPADSDSAASWKEASCKDAGIQKPDWMPDSGASCKDQVRHDAECPAACGGAGYSLLGLVRKSLFLLPQFLYIQRVQGLTEDFIDAELLEIAGRRGLHHEGCISPTPGSCDRYHLFPDRD